MTPVGVKKVGNVQMQWSEVGLSSVGLDGLGGRLK